MKKLTSSLALAILVSTGAINSAALAADSTLAVVALEKLPLKGKAPMTGYERSQFSDGWGSIGACDLRNYILRRDLTEITWRNSPACTVNTGVLHDPYTGKTINFVRGVKTSMAVQIDHVVALAAAWRTGAQNISADARYRFANDPLNLMAVDGPTNSQKSDSDAASWLPPKKSYRCAYVARQVAVKKKYKLWVVAAEKDAIKRVLATCPKQTLPKQ